MTKPPEPRTNTTKSQLLNIMLRPSNNKSSAIISKTTNAKVLLLNTFIFIVFGYDDVHNYLLLFVILKYVFDKHNQYL